MPKWQPDKERQRKMESMQQQGMRDLESGDIPPIAKERIQQHLAHGGNFFSSDLSVREFLLTKEAGIQPISQVMGACFYKVSYFGGTGVNVAYGYGANTFGKYSYFDSSQELKDITRAQSEVRRIAVQRLKREAQLLGASGVIGVRVKSRRPDVDQRSCEFQVYGTAIRLPDHRPEEEPFTCMLNGQEFWQLYKAGYKPKDVVMGVCSYYVFTDWYTQSRTTGGLMGNWTNQEISKYSDHFIDARHRAIGQLYQELSMTGATGCIGMQVGFDVEPIHSSRAENVVDLVLHFEVLGTAIQEHGSVVEPRKNTLYCIDLRKGKERAGVYL